MRKGNKTVEKMYIPPLRTLARCCAVFVLGLSLFIVVLTPQTGEGQELTCLPAPEGPLVETCPSSDGKCVRIKVGEPSFWSNQDKKDIAFVLRDVIDNKIPPLVSALKDLKKEVAVCESLCSFSPAGEPWSCQEPTSCTPTCSATLLTPKCVAKIEPIKTKILDAMKDLKPFVDRFDSAQPGSAAHTLQKSLQDVESCVLGNDKIPASCGDLVDPDLPSQDQVRILPEGSSTLLRKGLCPLKDWTNIFCIGNSFPQ